MKNKRFPFYPLLIAMFPVLSVIAENQAEIRLTDAFRSILLSALLPVILSLILLPIIRDKNRLAFFLSIVLVLFYSYGHVYNLLRDATIFDFPIFRHRYLATLWLVLLIIGLKVSLGSGFLRQKLGVPITISAITLLIFPLWSITARQIRSYDKSNSTMEDIPVSQISDFVIQDKTSPDIYYIILDAYSREDYLKEFYDFDNSDFLNSLRELGFYVAQCSRSNYSQTRLSLSSALNMDYIDAFYGGTYQDPSPVNVDVYREGLISYLKYSAVRNFLHDRGYKISAFETGWWWSELYGADHYLQWDNRPTIRRLGEGPNAFEVLFIRSTALSFITALSSDIADLLLPDLDFPNKQHRDRVLFVLDSLSQIPKTDETKFVFAHIVSPHKPFVFGPYGEVLNWEPSYLLGYPDQIHFLNKRVLEVIESILELSTDPPIIILQADHGALMHVGEEGRMAILNAYYFPDKNYSALYKSISPVNSFRVIFNQFFGQDFRLHEDLSLYSTYEDPINYTPIIESNVECID